VTRVYGINRYRYGRVICLTLLLCGLNARPVVSQSISVTVNTPVEFGVLPPGIPGDPPDAVYENTMGDVRLSMRGGGGAAGLTWYVTVQKSTAGWHSGLTLEVRRDADARLIDGESYVSIPDAPTAAYFFRTNNARNVNNLDIQHRVELTQPVPAATYSTTVTYTLIHGTPP